MNSDRFLAINEKSRLKTRYGISVEDRDALLLKQDGLCAICQENTATCIDHDHLTGLVRGILCHRCNIALGFYEKFARGTFDQYLDTRTCPPNAHIFRCSHERFCECGKVERKDWDQQMDEGL